MILSEQRRELVLRAVKANRGSRVGELADRFGVSEMTIRRDLDLLAHRGKLTRVRGGAMVEGSEPPFETTAVQGFEEKDRIGAAAASLVKDGETILIDIGTTTLQLAKHLHDRTITVITSNLAVYEELLPDNTVELVLLGGIVRRNYRSVIGMLTLDALDALRVDRTFLGASGLRSDLSVMDSTMEEVPIKRGMIAAATETALLLDSAKFGVGGIARICSCRDLELVVTDSAAPPPLVGELEEAGVEVMLA